MYREVTMIETRGPSAPRRGPAQERIAAQLGLDPKTVRRYLAAADMAGIRVSAAIGDDEIRQVLLALHPAGGRPRGDGWARCREQRAAIERWVGDGLRLTKIRKLLVRQGVLIAYPTPMYNPSTDASERFAEATRTLAEARRKTFDGLVIAMMVIALLAAVLPDARPRSATARTASLWSIGTACTS